MRTLRVALAQMNPTVGALAVNADRIIQLIAQAQDRGADLVAFPELALTGYPPEDLVLKPEFVADNLRELERVAQSVGDITAVVGFVDSDGTDIYNAAAIIQQGRMVGCYHKVFLPNYSVFDEQRYFKAGTQWAVYMVRGVRIGVTVCEDIWYPVGPATLQAIAGAEVIVNISSSPYRRKRCQRRHRMIATRATDELSYVCYLNAVGGQDELVFDGGSFICDQDGDRIIQGTFFQEDFLLADLDIDAVFSARLHDTRRRQSRFPIGLDGTPRGHMVETPLASPVDGARPPLSERQCEVPQGLAEVYSALVLGTRDYVRKNGAEQVYVALSGGIDSSLVATIAVDALGPDAVLGVLMPARYSSEGSVTDAELLARKLGIRTIMVPIEEAFSAYLHMLAEPFAGTQPDFTEENLQARVRGTIIMALSNKFGGIVLTTGNKSEMAVGYTTLYGDLAGGFAVIKDVFKTTVFDLARYKNKSVGKEVIPQVIIDKEPSPELRPGQRDVDSLPPYPILDGILKLYVEEDRSSTDIVAKGYDPETVTRVINLVDHSEYKRRQAPPGVKISVRAFGKDRRLPITDKYRDLPEIGSPQKVEQAAAEAVQQATGL